MAVTEGNLPKGVIPALITPMNEKGKIDYSVLEKHASYLSDTGVDGFFVGGTTGEGAYLNTKEKEEVFNVVRRVAQEKQFLCAAYLRPCTSMVLEEMRAIAKTRPDYVVAVSPYYTEIQQKDIVDHFRAIAHEGPAPLILYNIPANTHNPMTLETIFKLAEDSKIAGIKDSSGDFIEFSRGVLKKTKDDFAWIQGEDYLDASSLMLGCDGIVTGLGNVQIRPYVQMYDAMQRGDHRKVLQCQAHINRLRKIVNPFGDSVATIKAAATMKYRGTHWMRQRSLSLSEVDITQLEKELEEFDSISSI